MTYAKGDPRSKAAKRRHYLKNKQKYLENAKKQATERRDWFNAVKANPCVDCGGNFPPYVMDFDHLPDFRKAANVSRLRQTNYSLRTLMFEIAKCELVCANCHRIRTHNRRIKEKVDAQDRFHRPHRAEAQAWDVL